MNGDRRNPYVILGIPFGSSDADARGGFAKVTRRIRGASDPAFIQEDLTWALHQIEQILSDPTLAMHVFRIPANPTALESAGVGCFNPNPHGLPRGTKPSNAIDHDDLRRSCVADRLALELRAGGVRAEGGTPYELGRG